MMISKALKIFVSVLALVLGAGCAHYPVNEQSSRFDEKAGYRFDNLEPGPRNTDSLFVCLAFSGGGTRAAALAYGVLDELRRTTIKVDGQEKSLLDEVDCISSVSGGSFPAAYYGFFRERLFEDFRAKFLERNIQGALTVKLLNPVNLIRVSSPWFGRTDLAAELYDRDVFSGASFSGLEQKGRPLVILNATNLGPSKRFDFTQTHFDVIGSNLDQFHVSRAVAASSAFPFLLTPISLKNYPLAQGYQPPWWYQEALAAGDWQSPRYDAARNLGVYLDKKNGFVHLMDGGLSDNIGVRSILDAYDRGFIRTRINRGDIKRLVVIVVNARTESEDTLSRKEAPPGLITVAGKTATVAMDNFSFDSVDRLRLELYERVQTQMGLEACNRRLEQNCPDAKKFPVFGNNVDSYVLEVNFEALAFIPGEDPRYFLDLPTSFKLSKEQVDKLVAVGPRLLNASPRFQCLKEVLKAEAEGRPRPQECPAGAGIR